MLDHNAIRKEYNVPDHMWLVVGYDEASDKVITVLCGIDGDHADSHAKIMKFVVGVDAIDTCAPHTAGCILQRK